MTRGFVAKKNIALVIDGFQKFFQRCIEQNDFYAPAMKNFMEPIFEQAGYRDPIAKGKPHDNNILLIHDAAVGDFVSTTAAIREIRSVYPTAHITLMVTPMAMNLAEICPYVDEVFPFAMPWGNLPSTYQRNVEHAKFLLNRRIDVVYAFTHFPSTILLSYMSGARERISFDFSAEDGIQLETGPLFAMTDLLTVKVPLRLYGTHNIDRNLGLLDHALHCPIKNREPEVWFTPKDQAAACLTLRNNTSDDEKIYALCMGGSRASKKWSAENYADLFKMILAQEPNVNLLILGGGKADEFYAEVFNRHVGKEIFENHIFNFTGKIDYRQSAALLSFCDMYIGNDTDAMHMAAALKVPVLMPHYFAADKPMHDYTAPKIDYPYRVPSVTVMPEHALDDCKNSTTHYGCKVADRPHCITQVTVQTMFAAYQLLKKRIADNIIEPLFVF